MYNFIILVPLANLNEFHSQIRVCLTRLRINLLENHQNKDSRLMIKKQK